MIKQYITPEHDWDAIEAFCVLPIMRFISTFRTNRFRPSHSLLFIFSLDEARHAIHRLKGCQLDVLTHLNRASRLLCGGGLFLFLDTLSDLNVLDPKATFWNHRIQNVGKEHFVFCDLLTWDQFAIKSQCIEQTTEPKVMASYGRPLWSAFGDQKIDLVSLALAKLRGESTVEASLQPSQNPAADLAPLAARTDLDINTSMMLTQQLVGSHMAYLHLIEAFTGKSFLSYPSEPLLADGAKKFLTHRSNWTTCLKEATRLLKSRTIDKGERGELIAQILCLMAVDNAAKDDRSCPTVKEFLEQLVGQAHMSEILDKKIITGANGAVLGGKVNFNHFTKIIGYVPTRADIQEFVQRRLAVVCQDGQKGIDIIIPVILPSSYPGSGPCEPKTVNPGEGFSKYFIPEQKCTEILDKSPYYYSESQKAEGLLDASEQKHFEQSVNLVKMAYSFVFNGPHRPCREIEMKEASRDMSDGESIPERILDAGIGSNYVIDKDHASYILIQVKNYAAGWDRSLTCDPVEAGIESLQEGRKNRPFVSLGLVFDSSTAKSRVQPMKFRDECCAVSNAIQVTCVNPHMHSQWYAELDNMLKSYPGPAELSADGADKLTKMLGKAMAYGTQLVQNLVRLFKGDENGIEPYHPV